MPRAPDAVPTPSPARYEFRTDGTLLLTFDNASTEEEAWVLEEDDTVLVIRDGEATRLFAILELTADSLKLEEIPAVAGAEPKRYELAHP